MTAPLDRVAALIARAAHPATPLEEARTSAVIACRLIHELGILATASREQSSQRVADSPVRIIRSQFAGRCRVCGDDYDVGERIAWAKGHGAVHFECRQEWEVAA